MTIQWVTGFLDFPASVFEAGRHFWLGVTGYTLSPPRGPRADFATLVPGEGDAYLRVQRTYDGPAGCHLDFHTPDWARLAARATELGARQVYAEEALVVFGSPGGLPFCVSDEDDGPQLATSYLPLDIAGGTVLASTDPGPGGTYSRLADLGHAPATYTETARVRPPGDGEAQFLRMDPDQRVVTIQRTARTAAGRIVEVNQITFPAHQWELVYEWAAE